MLAVSPGSGQIVAFDDEQPKLSLGASPGTLEMNWFGHSGRAYFIKYSPTLDTGSWTYLPYVERGANATISFGANAPGPGERFFARTVITPSTSTQPKLEDFDNDGVSNMDELQAGLDPLSSVDSEPDGMPDDWEKFYFGDLSRDGTGDYDGDGVNDTAEYAAGRHPNTGILYGTVHFFWRAEDSGTKKVFFGDSRDESTIVATYSDTALTNLTSLRLYYERNFYEFAYPDWDPVYNPEPVPVVEYTSTTNTDGAHTLLYTGNTVTTYYMTRVGRDILRKIDGKPYSYVTTPTVKRVAAYSVLVSTPLTDATNKKFPTILRDLPYRTLDVPEGFKEDYLDFGNNNRGTRAGMLQPNLSTASLEYWRTPVYAFTDKNTSRSIVSPRSFAQWYEKNNDALAVTLSVQSGSALDTGYYYGFKEDASGEMANKQKNDVGIYYGRFCFTNEVHFKMDYDITNGPSRTVFNYSSDDDLWIYVNGKLVVDEGGIPGGSGTYTLADLDHNLTTNTGTCDVVVYYAEREESGSSLTFQSNSPLRPVYTYQVVVDSINGLTPTFALTTAPTGMTISPTGKIFWDYSEATNGNKNVVVQTTDRNGNTNTQSFTILVNKTLEFVRQPDSYNWCYGGDDKTLEALASGSPGITYQWYKGTTLLTGKTSRTLIITNAQLSDAGDYSVKATDASGTITSDTATLEVY